MFENITNIWDVGCMGINPVKSIVESIEMNDDNQEMVCNLANAATGILEDLYKCVERLSNEQNGQLQSAEVGRSHVAE